MAIKHQVVALNSSSSTLVSIPASAEAPYETRASISVQNLDNSIVVYIGTSSVTSSVFGYALQPGTAISFDVAASDMLYAIAGSGTPNVAVLAVEA